MTIWERSGAISLALNDGIPKPARSGFPVQALAGSSVGRCALFHRCVHQAAHQRAEIFALARALRHEHGEQLFLRIDPEERSGDPAPEELADRDRERRHALMGGYAKTEAEAVARRQT